MPPGRCRAARFSGRRRGSLQGLAVVIASGLGFCAPRWLTGPEFRAGLVLLALAGGYFALVHAWRGGGWAAILPKEAIVGGMFAAGSVFFAVCRSNGFPPAVWPGVVLFAVVCFLNCAFITRWERQPRDLRERSSLLNAFPRLTARLGLVCAGTAAAGAVSVWATGSMAAVPVVASAWLLAGLDRAAHRMSPEGLRLAADVVLLTPWLGVAFLPLTR